MAPRRRTHFVSRLERKKARNTYGTLYYLHLVLSTVNLLLASYKLIKRKWYPFIFFWLGNGCLTWVDRLASRLIIIGTG